MRREDLAQSLADAIAAVPGVAALSPGPGVEVATIFAGGKVVGLRLGVDALEVHIVADRVPLQPVADGVAEAARRVLTAAALDLPVHVVVDDIVAEALERRARF